MAKSVSEKEREKIVALLKEHKGNRHKVAKLSGRSKDTIARIAKEAGIESDVRKTKNATEARKAYAEERRLELIGKGFDKADALLSALVDATEFQKWTVGLGTLVDKARLETGEATNRSENRNENHNTGSLEEEFRRLDRKLEAESSYLEEEGGA